MKFFCKLTKQPLYVNLVFLDNCKKVQEFREKGKIVEFVKKNAAKPALLSGLKDTADNSAG